MHIEIPKQDREAEVALISKNDSVYVFEVDGKRYELDILMVEKGAYSVLHEGRSFNVETIPTDHAKKYVVNTIYRSYEIELIDAARRYERSRLSGTHADAENQIIVPMPGKIVSVFVKPGQEVKEGETLVIVSAMKMESEYKSGKDAVVKSVNVKDGDTVDGGLVMIELQ